MGSVGWAMIAFGWGFIARDIVHGRPGHLWLGIAAMAVTGITLIMANVLLARASSHEPR